jgi:RNA polymerase sigma factor (sigma-70 family)
MCQSSKLDTAKAEDISTESFLIAFEKIEKYEKEKSQFSTWLFTIAKNLMLQEIKNEQKTISMDVQVDEEGTTMKDFLQEEESDQHLQDLIQMKADIMMKKISELKEPYKQVIQMREINKMVYKDIASDLGDDVTFTILISNEVEQLPMELSKVYSILDSDKKNVTDFNLIEGDTKKTPFFTQINLNPGSYQIFGRRPKPLSTIKSQIRNGRALLIEATEKEYRILDEMYK